jgi:hypothetical protein
MDLLQVVAHYFPPYFFIVIRPRGVKLSARHLIIRGGPKVGIQYTIYYTLYTVYPLLAHLLYGPATHPVTEYGRASTADSHSPVCVIPDGVLIHFGPPDDEHLLLEICRGVK